MIEKLDIQGFAIFKQPLEWRGHGGLNLIIGENDTGKTHLLKLLYAVTRAAEEYWKKAAGPSPVDLPEILAAKLRWVFLPQQMELGRLVSRGGHYRLKVDFAKSRIRLRLIIALGLPANLTIHLGALRHTVNSRLKGRIALADIDAISVLDYDRLCEKAPLLGIDCEPIADTRNA